MADPTEPEKFKMSFSELDSTIHQAEGCTFVNLSLNLNLERMLYEKFA